MTARVHRPPARPGEPAPYARDDSFTFVRLVVEDDAGGRGEGGAGRLLAAEMAHFLDHTVPAALARGGPADPAALTAHLKPRGMIGVVVSALSALEIALADLEARRRNLRMAELLNSARDRAPVHVACGFPALEERALVAVCAQPLEDGARGVKVLVAARGRLVAEDVARLRAVRAAIGDAERIARVLVGGPPMLTGGAARLPDRPGLGFDPDEEAAARCRLPLPGDPGHGSGP